MEELSSLKDYVKKLFEDLQHHAQQLADVQIQMEQVRLELLQFSRADPQNVHQVAPRFQTTSLFSSVPPPAPGEATASTSTIPQVSSICISSHVPPFTPPAHSDNFTVSTSTVHAEQQKSPAVRHILQSVQDGCETIVDKYSVSCGLVYRKANSGKQRLFVPAPLVDNVLQAYKQSNGVQGLFKTYRHLHGQFFWPKMWSSVKRFVKASLCNADSVSGPPPDVAHGAAHGATAEDGVYAQLTSNVQDHPCSRPTAAVLQSSPPPDPAEDMAEERYAVSVFSTFRALMAEVKAGDSQDGHCFSDLSDDVDTLCHP